MKGFFFLTKYSFSNYHEQVDIKKYYEQVTCIEIQSATKALCVLETNLLSKQIKHRSRYTLHWPRNRQINRQ